MGKRKWQTYFLKKPKYLSYLQGVTEPLNSTAELQSTITNETTQADAGFANEYPASAGHWSQAVPQVLLRIVLLENLSGNK